MAEDNSRLTQHLERKLKIYENASGSERYAELAKATKAKLEDLKPKPKPKAKSGSSSKSKSKE